VEHFLHILNTIERNRIDSKFRGARPHYIAVALQPWRKLSDDVIVIATDVPLHHYNVVEDGVHLFNTVLVYGAEFTLLRLHFFSQR
jgi:hypothetical protein